MYLKLFQSYVRWLESRGRSLEMARVVAALALTIAALLNVGAIVLLVQDLGGPPLIDWTARHSWITWVAVFALAATHLLMSQKIRPIGGPTQIAATRLWWTTYMVLTMILWMIATALTLASMTSARI